MTINEVIQKVDELSPNQYEEQQKISWLANLDTKIYNELYPSHHVGFLTSPFPPEPDPDLEHELLVPHPYAEGIYTYYLMAMIANMNAEVAKYNQYITMYAAEYQEYQNWFNRTFRPKFAGGFRF